MKGELKTYNNSRQANSCFISILVILVVSSAVVLGSFPCAQSPEKPTPRAKVGIQDKDLQRVYVDDSDRLSVIYVVGIITVPFWSKPRDKHTRALDSGTQTNVRVKGAVFYLGVFVRTHSTAVKLVQLRTAALIIYHVMSDQR